VNFIAWCLCYFVVQPLRLRVSAVNSDVGFVAADNPPGARARKKTRDMRTNPDKSGQKGTNYDIHRPMAALNNLAQGANWVSVSPRCPSRVDKLCPSAARALTQKMWQRAAMIFGFGRGFDDGAGLKNPMLQRLVLTALTLIFVYLVYFVVKESMFPLGTLGVLAVNFCFTFVPEFISVNLSPVTRHSSLVLASLASWRLNKPPRLRASAVNPVAGRFSYLAMRSMCSVAADHPLLASLASWRLNKSPRLRASAVKSVFGKVSAFQPVENSYFGHLWSSPRESDASAIGTLLADKDRRQKSGKSGRLAVVIQ
jgi:hypothetical protein